MKRHWWKVLSVILLLYTFMVGLLTPLRTGITAVAPTKAKTGTELRLSVEGYNSNFTASPDALRAWLKYDNEHALFAKSAKALDDRHVELTFDIPSHLPGDKKVKDFTLLLDHPTDGASVLPSAVFISQDSVSSGAADPAWQSHPMENLHEQGGITFPFRNILKETIRNTYFHVPQWFAMLFIFIASVVHSIQYLRKPTPQADRKAVAFTSVGLLFGLIGLFTGAVWANYTWGKPWSWDIKQNMTAVVLLIYFAYYVLRSSFDDAEKRARLAAVYNIFAFASIIPLLYVIPRLVDSLHPGSGGNPAFGSEDLDNTMRMVFYPAIIGWTLLGFWIADVFYRIKTLENYTEENDI